MPISQGDTLPDATLVEMGADGPAPVQISDKVKGRKVVIFAVPGAFTPTCHSAHVPSFVRTKDQFDAKGVDEIICVSTDEICAAIKDIFDDTRSVSEPAGALADPGDVGVGRGVDRVVDEINRRFGDEGIAHARTLLRRKE